MKQLWYLVLQCSAIKHAMNTEGGDGGDRFVPQEVFFCGPQIFYTLVSLSLVLTHNN